MGRCSGGRRAGCRFLPSFDGGGPAMPRTGWRWLVLTGVVVGLTGTATREASAQVASLRFDPRLLPARPPLAGLNAGLRAQALRFDARLLPARPALLTTSPQALASDLRFNAP